MKISLERLQSLAESTGYPPVTVEKVVHLTRLLDGLNEHPFLAGKFALKGGTALNLFFLDMPRLSVDIDLNYIGAAARDAMLAERPALQTAVGQVFQREGYSIKRAPTEHAGGKWRLGYESALGQSSNLEVDMNFVFRIPLWEVAFLDSRPFGPYRAHHVPVVDPHELAGGKLTALFARCTTRDVLDAGSIVGMLRNGTLSIDRLRLAFVVLGAGNRRDWRTVTLEDIDLEARDLERDLGLILRRDARIEQMSTREQAAQWTEKCREGLSPLLPFTRNEKEFLDQLLDHGAIQPSLLTDDPGLQDRIQRHPLLIWKAENARAHRSG